MKTKWSQHLAVRPEQKAYIQTLFSYMNARGLKFSKQRAAVIEYFVKADRHFTVEQLYLELKKKYHLGYSTVYRTLKLLVDSGVATVHHFGVENTRFELIHQEGHHDHFVCRQCGKIIEFHHDGIERLQQKVAKTRGFIVDDHELQLFGLCKTCRSAQKKKGSH
ncbi:transcriptional repressor [candidate division WOR-3 bacterium]|nr:transcriptional repressor [candidate division WOR-3 bacterium]